MTIIFDDRWRGEHGIGRFAQEVFQADIEFVPLSARGTPFSAFDSVLLSFELRTSNSPFFSPGYNFPLTFRGPYVMTIHDINPVDVDSNSGFFKKLYFRTLLSSGVRRAEKIFTVSHFSKQRISSFFGIAEDKVVNVGNGVSSAFFKSGTPSFSERPFILSVTNRKSYKNDVRAITAFSECAFARSKGIDLYFTGSPDPVLERLAFDLGVESHIRFLGTLSEGELVAAYKASRAVLFVSSYEGFGLPIIEAFASGVPCITSNVTSMPEVAGDAAFLCDPFCTTSISDAMTFVLSDERLRSQMIRRGFERARLYTWDSTRHKIRMEFEKMGWVVPEN